MTLLSRRRKTRQLTTRQSTALVREGLLGLVATFSAMSAVAQDVAAGTAATQSAGAVEHACTKRLWVGAYVPGWNQGSLDPKHDHALDAVTHFLHFAVYFRPGDGSLDLRTNELTPSKMRALVSAAHEAGKQVLLVVGGEGAAPGLRIAANLGRLQRTVGSILSLVDRYGYDGVDVDWEPITPQDAHLYSGLVKSLRKRMDETAPRQRRQRLALTTAIEVDLNDKDYMTSLVETLRKLDGTLDRINLMTYTMANPKKLPFVWHNSALYPSSTSPRQGFQTPSADGAVRAFFAAGIQPSKLGIGINLHGYLWTGRNTEDVSAPGQTWKVPPTVVELTYGEVLKEYFNPNWCRWDEEAEAPYISIRETNQFISYEDSRGIEAKLRYVQSNGLGGIIIWDIGRDDQGHNAKRHLLEVMNKAPI